MDNNIFEKMATKYDSEERIALANVILKAVRKELQHANDQSLIDYGGGTGLVSLQLLDLVDSILLIDSSAQMLEAVQSKISYANLENVDTLHADFTKEDPTVKADIVLVSLVLLHVPNTKQLLQALYKLLNDDGKLLIVDFDENDQVNHPKIHSGFRHEDLEKILNEVGFKETKIDTFYHGKEIFAKQDASMFLASSKK